MITEKCPCGAEVSVNHATADLEQATVATWRTDHRHGDTSVRESLVDAYIETATPHQPHAPLGFGLPPRPTTTGALGGQRLRVPPEPPRRSTAPHSPEYGVP